ncbi:PREDICTED: up-regulated during skeletal muscle growth protein 5 [Habropoda laboriosa]|uniref:up-regulated during skeletal muscle growth protein 5 n=1 Tax=Habropoda laboriosa TaxID=597456 RepID=UPI00083D1A90|nr:PREDICTED: up-regulated during skeletal muscle growth protein 5 [Habropoda laboriosa]
MADDKDIESKLTGFSKYYNSVTVRGRANVAMSTLGAVAALILYFTLKPKKAAQK